MASHSDNMDFLKDISADFYETDGMLQKDVETLMQWLEGQPHLPSVKDPHFLALFLLRCKARMEKTKEMLQAYYIAKARLHGVFRNRDPDSAEYRKLFDVMTMVRSRKMTESGNGVLTLRVGNVPAGGLPSSKEYLKYMVIQALIHVLMAAPCKKFVVILDYRNAPAAMINYQLMCMKNVENLSLMVVWKEAATELTSQIPQQCLPIEYGGTEGNFQELAERCFEEVKSWKWWLDDEEQHVSDLSKRPSHPKLDNVRAREFGTRGSFKRINVE